MAALVGRHPLFRYHHTIMTNDATLLLPRTMAHALLMRMYALSSAPNAETTAKLNALAPSKEGSPWEDVKDRYVTTLTLCYIMDKNATVPDFRCNRYDGLACRKPAIDAFVASIQ